MVDKSILQVYHPRSRSKEVAVLTKPEWSEGLIETAIFHYY